MGNPSFYCKGPAKVPLETVGPVLENALMFRGGSTSHFVQVHSPQRCDARVRTRQLTSPWPAAPGRTPRVVADAAARQGIAATCPAAT
jgi:hypothetical protein